MAGLKSILFVAGAAVMIAATSPANAALTYNYTGSPFTSIGDPVLGKSITGSVTFNDSVTKNFTGEVNATLDPSSLINYSLKSGRISLSSINSDFGGGDFIFSNGKIVEWYLGASEANINISTEYFGAPGFTFDIVSSDAHLANDTWTAGQWTEVSPVPLPGALLLFGSGLAGLAGLGATRLREKKAALLH